MALKDYGLSHRDGKIKLLNGRKTLLETELVAHLMEKGLALSQIEKIIPELKEEVNNFVEDNNISQAKLDIIKELNPFRNLTVITNTTNRSDVVYYKNGTETEVVCALHAFGPTELRAILCKYEPEFLDELHSRIAPLLNAKDWTLVSDSQVLATCFNTRLFNSTVTKISVTLDLHPATLETCDVMSLVKIPFSYMDYITFDHLDPQLQELFRRIEHHEYICAILYSHFIGNLLPYVIYLHGSGGDSKTAFINMLGRLTRSYATFDTGERFNYFNMYGKAIIGLAENESSKIMQNRVLKSISGGNYVKIEGKGDNSFSGQVRGLIFVDSNYDLELLGREDEKRRLRYFRVAPIAKNENFVPIAQDYFVGEMGSKSNEFLNYCRVCFEELEIKGSHGLIKAPPNHEQTFQDLIDHIEVHKFNIFHEQHVKDRYVLGGKTESLNILLEVEKKFPKDSFAVRNFKKYMEVHHGIKTSGKYFLGMTKFDKELEDALPANKAVRKESYG